MKNILRIIPILLILFVAVAPAAHAQVLPAVTTLSTAVTNGATAAVTIASSGSVVVRSGGIVQTVFVIDQEVMAVLDLINGPSCSTTCTYSVTRGYRATSAMAHESGALVVVAALNKVYDTLLAGSCTASAQDLPRIVIGANQRPTAVFFQACRANQTSPTSGVGEWANETLLDNALPDQAVSTVPIGSVAYGSFGSAQNTVAGSFYYTNVIVERTTQFTGIKVLAGATVGTDKWIGIVWDSLGNVIMTSITSGITTANANTFQTLPFTSKVILPGPARYFIGLQSNGTTDLFRATATSTFVGILDGSTTGTFGTAAAITPPTTNNTKGPIAYLYQ